MSLFHGGLTLGGARDLFCDVKGHGRVCFTNSPGTFDLCNITRPRRQVTHRYCDEHDLVYVPGLGRRSVTIMMRSGLFPHLHSRMMGRLPLPVSLWTCLKNIIVDSMQKPGLRMPTLEEVMQETTARARATDAAAMPRVTTRKRARREATAADALPQDAADAQLGVTAADALPQDAADAPVGATAAYALPQDAGETFIFRRINGKTARFLCFTPG